MICSSCQHDNPPGSKFCLECGSAFGVGCPSCGAELPANAKFCNECGQATAATPAVAAAPERTAPEPRSYTPKHLADKILQSKSVLEGERKQVTVLFADVKGSMELSEQVNPEAWHRILDRFFQILTDGVHRFEGTINQYTGDGIMALFGAPIAHEDHAHRACWAALRLVDELRGYADDLRRSEGLSFSARIGLNSGEVIVGKIGDDLRMDYTAQGHTVGLAQRMEQLAEPGRCYLTDSTAKLVGGYFELRDLGAFDVKGVREAVRVHQLQGTGALRTRLEVSRTRGLSRFVGRQDEMNALDAALERVTEGNGQVVGIVAEAGTGKSRICFEFAERCRARGMQVHEAHAVPYGKNVPMLPVLELMRAAFGITPSDSDQAARDRIAGRILLLDDSLKDALPLVFDFLGVPDPERPAPPLDADARQRRLFDVIRRVANARSRREPAIFLVEDLHWLDEASEVFLEQFVEGLPSSRSLLLVNFRPEYSAPWAQRSHYRQLPIPPLGTEDMGELLRDLLGDDPSLDELAPFVTERAGGNPFYIEEVVRSLEERGQLEGERGAYRLSTPIEALEVPATVEALIAARIDRLGEREKQVLQTAAVIGKSFSEPVLSRVAPVAETELAEALRNLTAAEFVYEEALYPVAEYAFQHPLVQDVAYGSQLGERRARLHASAARAIEEVEADRIDEQAALIAHHWEAAGENVQAAEWHHRATRRAGLRDADETLRHLWRVIELLEGVEESPETLRLGVEARAEILNLGQRVSPEHIDLAAVLEQGQALAERAEDPLLRFHWLRGLGTYRLFDNQIEGCLDPLHEATRLADEIGDPELQSGIRYFLGIAHLFAGPAAAASEQAETALELLERHPGSGSQMIGMPAEAAFGMFAGGYRLAAGEYGVGTRRILQALELARDTGDGEGLVSGLAAWWIQWTRPELALPLGRRAVELAEEGSAANIVGMAYLGLGRALLASGQADEAVEAFQTSLERGALFQQLTGQPPLVLALARAGRLDEALDLAPRALATVQEAGSRFTEIDARLAYGEALLVGRGLDAADEIERHADAAVRLIDETGFRMYYPLVCELRSALCKHRGDRDGAARHLREAQTYCAERGADAEATRMGTLLAAL